MRAGNRILQGFLQGAVKKKLGNLQIWKLKLKQKNIGADLLRDPLARLF
jgi:hypothetical protein